MPETTLRTLNMELTNDCPMSCVMCPRRKMTRPIGYMTKELFYYVISQVEGLTVRLHQMGESLLHPRLGEFIQEAKRYGHFTILSANPQFLSDKAIRDICHNRLDTIHLMSDGVTSEKHKEIRGSTADLGKALRRARALVEYRNQHGGPEIIAPQIQMRDTQGKIAEFRRIWGDVGVDVVKPRPYTTWGTDDKDIHELTPGDFVPRTCNSPWVELVIQWDGKVVPCCLDYDGKQEVGDANTQTLQEIWSGESIEELREALLSKELPTEHPCLSCDKRMK